MEGWSKGTNEQEDRKRGSVKWRWNEETEAPEGKTRICAGSRFIRGGRAWCCTARSFQSPQVPALTGNWESRISELPCIQLPPVPVAVQKAEDRRCSVPGWCLSSKQIFYGSNHHLPRRYPKASCSFNCFSSGMTSKFQRIWCSSF